MRELADAAARGRRLLVEVSETIAALLAGDETTAAARIRHAVDRMCRVTDWVALCGQAQWELGHDGGREGIDALRLYALLELERADPITNPELVELHRRFAQGAGTPV